MRTEVYIGHRLDGFHWKSCTAACETLDQAIDCVKSHIKMNPSQANLVKAAVQNQPDLDCRVYQSEDPQWVPTIIEFGPNSDTPMMALAVYKIIKAYLGEPA